MTEALHYIRKAIIDRLTDAITINGSYVPVYNRVPSSVSEPYIKVSSISNNEIDQNATSFNTECITRIEVVTAFTSDDGGELQSNQIVSEVLRLIRTRSSGYYDLSGDNFNVYTCTNENTTYFEDDLQDKTYFRAIIEISNRLEKI
jgi:hypothetical protein